jgi:hypothetical protein
MIGTAQQALDFALDQEGDFDIDAFLRSWRDGRFCDIPAFTAWLAEQEPDLSVLGEATGTNPLDLMAQLGTMIRLHYIGVSSSQHKADKLAEKILVLLTDHYEQEAARMATEAGSEPIAPTGQTR